MFPLTPLPMPVPDDPGEAAGFAAALAAENAALRVQVGRARLILDGAVDHAIVTLDRDGRITGWNTGARRILGYAEAEVLGRSGEIVFTPEDRAIARFATELNRAAEAGSALNERWHVRRDGTRFWASGTMLSLRGGDGRLEGFLNILRDRTEARTEAERRDLLMGEMNHRIRNTFATVQAVAAQTWRHTPEPAAFHASFEARLQALSRSHDALIEADWNDIALRTLVEGAVDAYGGEPGRVSVEGPPVLLAASLAVPVSLVFHELATNAVKHGALREPQGRVAVAWTTAPARDGAGRVDILWRERGGPPVQPPKRRGFGSRLLERSLSPGMVRLEFRPDGLECRVSLPLGDGS